MVEEKERLTPPAAGSARRRPHRSGPARWLAPIVLLTSLATLLIGVEPASAALRPDTVNMTAPGPGILVADTRYANVDRDGAMSVSLPGNKILWIFADTTRDAFSIKGSAAIADRSNPALTTTSTRPDGQPWELLPGAYAPCPEGQVNAAWPTSAVGIPQSPTTTIVVIYFMVNCAILGTTYSAPQRMGVATMFYDAHKPHSPLIATVLNSNLFPTMDRGTISKVAGYGSAAVLNPNDGHIYVYGCGYDDTGVPNCPLARVWAGDVADPAHYRFWKGTSYQPGMAGAVSVDIGGIISVNPSVQWIPELGRYVSLNLPYSFDTFEVRTALKPEGPWSPATTVPLSDCTGTICRTVALHASLSSASQLSMSYTVGGLEKTKVVPVPISVDPFGSFESISSDGTTVTATGWALDPDVASAIPVAVYVDGVGVAQFTAATPRPDVGAAYPGYGQHHGFTATFAASPGNHTVCIYAINQVLGTTNPRLGCRYVNVTISKPGPPQQLVATAGDGQALVSWAPPAQTGGVPTSALTYAVDVVPAVPGSPFDVGNRTSLVVSGLANGTNHRFQVRATNVSGSGVPASTTATPVAGAGSRFHPVTPTRLVDTRASAPLAAGTVRTVAATGVAGVPTNATAVIVNVTATQSTANSFLTVFPAGQPAPATSNLNFGAGQTIANLATVRLGAGGALAMTTAAGTTHAVVDVVGWYDDGSLPGDHFNATAPARVLDSRTGTGWVGKLAAGAPRSLTVAGVGGVPPTATAVVINVTATQSSANSYVTAYPTGDAAPNASTVNFGAQQTVANLATVKVGEGGGITFATAQGQTDLVADIVGWYEPGSGDLFHPLLAPGRILDDRIGLGGYHTPLPAGAGRSVTVVGAGGVPGGATAVVANVTATGSTAPSFLTVHPNGTGRPNASTVNFAAGATVPNLVMAKVGEASAVRVATAAGSVSVVLDVSGWFAPT